MTVREYFDTDYKWINEDHEINETRAYTLFKHGKLLLARRTITVEPRHIDLWLEKTLIEEVN